MSVAEHVYHRLLNAPITKQPFPHLFCDRVFPDDFYAALLKALPGDEAYEPSAYPDRSMLEIRKHPDPVLSQVHDLLCDREFLGRLISRFAPSILARFDTLDLNYAYNVRLVRDGDGYFILPHTDNPEKLVSALFYLPSDESMLGYGTELLIPKDTKFTCEGEFRHAFEKFETVAKAPFAPNCCLAFVKTPNAFHGVRPIKHPGLRRNVLLLNIGILPNAD